MSVKFYKNEVWGHEEMSVKIYGNVVGEVRPDGSQWVHMKDYDTLRAENKLHCAELTALRAELINLGEHLAEIGYANATLAEIPEIIKDRLRDNANCARKLAKANAVCEALYLKDVSWWSDVDTAISAWRASTAAPQPPDAKEEG